MNRPFGVLRVCEEWGVSRSTYYARLVEKEPPGKRGPKPAQSDQEVIQAMKEVIAESPFTGEGHRKIRRLLRHKRKIRIGRVRCLHLMRIANLQPAPIAKRTLGPRNHDGTITTGRPDKMWGIDATGTFTVEEGQVKIFIAVDHCATECVGIHAAKYATRYEALEPIRQGVRRCWTRWFQNLAELLEALHAWVRTYNEQWMVEKYDHQSPFEGRAKFTQDRVAA